MSSADVSLKIDRHDRICFAHSPLKAVFFTLISAGFTLICWFFITDNEAVRWFFTGFSLLFVLAGVVGIFWRMELDIDLGTRRVRIRKGLWPAAKTRFRPLDEADGVWLTMDYRSSGSNSKNKVPWWFVSLKFPEDRKGTRIHASTNEVDGFRKWEYYAKRLQIDAVNATTQQEERAHWKKLDDKLADEASGKERSPRRVSSPPAGSGIEWTHNAGRREILLPATGFSGGLVFLLLFGGAFAAMGATVLLATASVIEMQVQGGDTALMVVPPVFIAAGLGIMWLGIRGSFSAMIVGVANSRLFIEYLTFGRRSGKKSIALADIESVSVTADVRARRREGARIRVGGIAIGRNKLRRRDNEVVVRSDQKIPRFGGSLSKAGQEWLAEACHFAAASGRLP